MGAEAKKTAKECTVCFEEIHPNAVKCTKCNSYQNWLRHIHVSSSVLALLVALASVITSLTALKISLPDFQEKTERITAGWSSTEENDFTVWVVNEGNGTGILERRFKVDIGGSSYVARLYASDSSWYIFEPGAKRLFFVVSSDPMLKNSLKSPNVKIKGEAYVNQSSGLRRSITLESP